MSEQIAKAKVAAQQSVDSWDRLVDAAKDARLKESTTKLTSNINTASARIISPNYFKGGYDGLRRFFGKNPDENRSILLDDISEELDKVETSMKYIQTIVSMIAEARRKLSDMQRKVSGGKFNAEFYDQTM
jgi:hypothetical protein